MDSKYNFEINDNWIIAQRGIKNKVDAHRPYAFFVEDELTASGKIEKTAVIFLVNSECPFRCLMCDLWKNTSKEPVPEGAIPEQIEWALNQLPPAKHIKLYNSGNFFDSKAIPVKDYTAIASLVKDFDTVIIENHPKFINEKSLLFRDMLNAQLQIAIGLETVNAEILQKLNKKMSMQGFQNAVRFLKRNGISTRAFILLNPPFLNGDEGIFWAKKSIEFAFRTGVECCTVIPVRAGNGVMDILFKNNYFTNPNIRYLEKVIEFGIGLNSGRVFSDTWDLEKFSDCPQCFSQRRDRLISMNLFQKITPSVQCACNVK